MTRDNITGILHTNGRLQGALSVGGGVSSYNELEDLPTMNGHIIEGDMTPADLDIWQPKDFSTTEQNTGLKWVDGKDIYKITIEFPTRRTISTIGWATIFPHNNVYDLVFNCLIMNNDGVSYIVDCACNHPTEFEIYVQHSVTFDNITFYYTKN